MKRLLSLSLLLSVTALSAQSFEWDKPAAAAHPKEIQRIVPADDIKSGQEQGGLAGIYAPDADGTPTAYGEIYRANELTGSHPALPLGTLLRVTNISNGRSVVVRITDRGQECADCVVTLSNTAAHQLGMSEKAAVTIERDGFSNWNPVPQGEATSAAENVALPAASAVLAPQPVSPETAAESEAARPSVFSREVTSPGPIPAISEAPKGEAVAYQSTVTPPTPTVANSRQSRGGDDIVEQASFTVQLAAYNNEAYAVQRVQELKEKGLDNAYYRSITKEDGEVINRVFAGTYLNLTDAQAAARDIAGQYNITGIVSKL
ncbi:rare lipoprotein A [Neolewinella xylanilytica]|uniref:Rare lipoprotein A n=1 Tax=Neolewinella xylanilytica TaxID=1514080 RepID=A0A2S6I3I3_9BACT|nr:RlpA-like double-psi beta-barrel domain-containing protein [Neolewinella xylanilytica]PPK85725.1 rare lipoprotein A [Neolewinella xylanilytica]